jgi:hypothetical protein
MTAANINAPFGFSPVRTLTGENLGQPLMCFHPSGDATALYVGDVVKLTTGTADTNAYGVPSVIAATAGDVPLGVVVAVDPILTSTGSTAPNLYIDYLPASTAGYIYVQPMLSNVVFSVQCTSTSAYADIGKMAPINAGSGGNTTNGISGMYLGTPTTSATGCWFIISASRLAGNAMTGNYCIYDVTPNVSLFTGSATGV